TSRAGCAAMAPRPRWPATTSASTSTSSAAPTAPPTASRRASPTRSAWPRGRSPCASSTRCRSPPPARSTTRRWGASAMPEQLLAREQYSIARAEKERLLRERLAELTEHHRAACEPYARVLDLLWDGAPTPFAGIADVPWLPVQLFKTHELRSI